MVVFLGILLLLWGKRCRGRLWVGLGFDFCDEFGFGFLVGGLWDEELLQAIN